MDRLDEQWFVQLRFWNIETGEEVGGVSRTCPRRYLEKTKDLCWEEFREMMGISPYQKIPIHWRVHKTIVPLKQHYERFDNDYL